MIALIDTKRGDMIVMALATNAPISRASIESTQGRIDMRGWDQVMVMGLVQHTYMIYSRYIDVSWSNTQCIHQGLYKEHGLLLARSKDKDTAGMR